MSNAHYVTTMFRYKAWANGEMLTALQGLDGQTHRTERHSAVFILNHTYLVDRIFAAHLTRAPMQYTATTATENPPLEDLSAAIAASDAWFIDYVAGLGPQQLSEVIDFTFTDGDPGRMSRAEILIHLITHGAYHRGGIGRIMSQVSVPPPRDVFTGLPAQGRVCFPSAAHMKAAEGASTNASAETLAALFTARQLECLQLPACARPALAAGSGSGGVVVSQKRMNSASVSTPMPTSRSSRARRRYC